MLNIVLKTPIGVVHSVHTSNGVHSISLDKSYNEDPNIVSKLPSKLNVEVLQFDGPTTAQAKVFIQWMQNFFGPSPPAFLPELDNEILNKDNFTALVLRTLMNDTMPGTTLSYAELAKRCGNPKACRAVGQAMRANPLPLVVPCHRVVRSSGKLGHYMSGDGDNIKAWLIDHEKKAAGVV